MSSSSPWLLANVHHIKPESEVLDLACGKGRHCLPLLQKKCRVWAVDKDDKALAAMAPHSSLLRWAWDLEQGEMLPKLRVDAALIFNYLHRPLFANLAAHIKPGGLLLHETFHISNQHVYGRPRRAHFCWEDGEAEEFFADHGFEVTASYDGVLCADRRLTQIAARRK